MNDHTWLQARKNVDHENGYVRIHKAAVRAVEKQNVIWLQLLKQCQIANFEPDALDTITDSIDLRARLWIDRNDLGIETSVSNRLMGEAGCDAGANLKIDPGAI